MRGATRPAHRARPGRGRPAAHRGRGHRGQAHHRARHGGRGDPRPPGTHGNARGAVLQDDRVMSAEAITIERAEARRARAGRPGVGAVYRWELRKLVAQKRTYLGLGAVLVIPLIFVVALLADSSGGGPDGVPFGQYVRQRGLARPPVPPSFGSIWLMPLGTALVAGDIVATEDQHGTLKTILTRSAERWHVFAVKA